MPRPPVGTTAQSASRAALAAEVARRMAGIGSSRSHRDEWLGDVARVRIRSNGLDRVANRLVNAARPWLLVDEEQVPLDLARAIVVFPGRGGRRQALESQLKDLGLVRQLLLTKSRRDLWGVLVFPKEDAAQVFAAVEALGEPFLWDDVLSEDRAIEARLWLAIARRFAASEELLEDES